VNSTECGSSQYVSSAGRANIHRIMFLSSSPTPDGSPTKYVASRFQASTSNLALTTYAGVATRASSRYRMPGGTSLLGPGTGDGSSPATRNRYSRSSVVSSSARASAASTCREGRGPRACSSLME
jgi:hypothetical protein